MKIIFSMLVVCMSLPAFAKVDGLTCKMEYSTSSVLSTSLPSSVTAWKVAGDEMEGSAFRADGNGGWGTTPANFLKIDTQVTKGQTFWKVSVLDADKNLVGVFSFKKDDDLSEAASGMKISLPVNAFDEGDEDPTNFDVLEVSCYNTVFAG